MKICIISKYPPIEGGVSSGIYWLAKALGELNHKVYIVTNSLEVEDAYREEIRENESGKFEPKNVKVYSTNVPPPRFIPYYNPFIAKLANLAIQVIRKYDLDLIYSEYLLPYGIAALIAKQITQKPLMVKHAGSDITRLFDSPSLQSLFIEVFKGADMILTTPKYRDKILKRTKIKHNKFVMLRLLQGINLKEFHPDVEPFDISLYFKESRKKRHSIFLYLGKVSRLKKTFEFVKACSSIKNEHFRLIFVVGNNKNT